MSRRWAAALLLMLSGGGAAAAQDVGRAVRSITPEDIRRRIGIIADDSMRGRDTPSPELDQVARYIAGEFRRFGLRPGGDAGSFLQRYRVLWTRPDTTASQLVIATAGRGAVTLKLGSDVLPLPLAPPPTTDLAGPVVLLAGPPASDSTNPLAGIDVKGAWVVLPGATANGGTVGLAFDERAARAAMRAEGGARGVIILSDRPAEGWKGLAAAVLRPLVALDAPPAPAVLELREAAAVRGGLDPAALRASPARLARRLTGVTITFRPRVQVLRRITAPNVVGILEGRDPRLKHEYLVVSAHMDHVGVGPAAAGGDSIFNGADDDASGTIAVVEAAEAFARLTPRPRRSVIFLTVSGEEKGLWGSAHFTTHPPVPAASIVADLNIDMVGRNWRDTIVAIGKEHSDLGATLDRVAAAHPELAMHPIDDLWPQENFYRRSDHFNFARKGIPILFFFNGTHADYHRVTDSPDKIDAEKEARIVKLLFYLGLEIANRTERPRWNPESYRLVVDGAR